MTTAFVAPQEPLSWKTLSTNGPKPTTAGGGYVAIASSRALIGVERNTEPLGGVAMRTNQTCAAAAIAGAAFPRSCGTIFAASQASSRDRSFKIGLKT